MAFGFADRNDSLRWQMVSSGHDDLVQRLLGGGLT